MWETGLRPLPKHYQTFWFWASEARATDASCPFTVLETVFDTVSSFKNDHKGTRADVSTNVT